MFPRYSFSALCCNTPYKPDITARVLDQQTWRIFPPKCGMLTSPVLARLHHHPAHIWYAPQSVYSVPVVSNTIEQQLGYGRERKSNVIITTQNTRGEVTWSEVSAIRNLLRNMRMYSTLQRRSTHCACL